MGTKVPFAVLCAGALLGASAGPAQATFPGSNGRIAYTWSRGAESLHVGPHPRLVGIFSVRPDGGDRRLVARGGSAPRYSPSGRRIAFWRANRLWAAAADGKGARPVSPRGWIVGSGGVWSPRGTRLAFVRDFGSGGRQALYTARPDGSGLTLLARSPEGIAIRPGAWSPDGKAIVYAQYRITGPTLARVVRGGRVTTLGRGFDPTWSRRGLVAYTTPAAPGQTNQVCIRPGHGGSTRCLAYAPASTSDPTWSPDGRRLMVMYTPAGPAEIWIVRPDGTVLSRAARDDVFPTFSPDGRMLAFSRYRFAGERQYTDLHVMRPDGGGRRLIVRGGQAQAPDWQRLRPR
jgi:TolB protein